MSAAARKTVSQRMKKYEGQVTKPHTVVRGPLSRALCSRQTRIDMRCGPTVLLSSTIREAVCRQHEVFGCAVGDGHLPTHIVRNQRFAAHSGSELPQVMIGVEISPAAPLPLRQSTPERMPAAADCRLGKAFH
jgi:hypothetical protein